MNKEELINQVVEKKIASQEEGEREYKRFEEDVKKQFSFLSEEDRIDRVKKQFSIYFRALAKTDLRNFEGLILSSTGKNYITKRRIEKIMKEYNENPEQAINDGKVKIINGQPIAVEPLKYWKKGTPDQRDNPNYGKPLNENSVQKTVEGIFMLDGVEKKFSMQLRDDFVFNIQLPLLKPIRMKVALGGSISSDIIRLIPRRGSKFEVMEDKKIDVIKIIEKHYSDDIINIGDIEKTVANAKNTFALKKIVKGQVLELNLIPNATGSGGFRLMEETVGFEGETNDCRIKIPEEWLESIDFGEFSTVYVLGNPWVFTGEGDTKMIGITAQGIYPILKTKPIEVNDVQRDDVNGNGEVPKNAPEFNDYNKPDEQTVIGD